MKIKQTTRTYLITAIFLTAASTCHANRYSSVQHSGLGFRGSSFSKPTLAPDAVNNYKYVEKAPDKDTGAPFIFPEQKLVVYSVGTGYTQVEKAKVTESEKNPGLNKLLSLIKLLSSNIANSPIISGRFASNYTLDTIKAFQFL